MTIGPRVNQLVSHDNERRHHGSQQHGGQPFGGVEALTHLAGSSHGVLEAVNARMMAGVFNVYKIGHDGPPWRNKIFAMP
jgi:hypothetical protein